MKEKIKKILEKYPLIYSLAQKILWQISGLKVKFCGTTFLENYWQRKEFNDFSGVNHPHRSFLIEKIANLQPFLNILEIGCGYALNLYLLAKKFPQAKFTGIDINQKAIEAGKKLLKKERIKNVELLVGKADKLNNFPEKNFDVVFTDAVLMYIGPDKIKGIIREILRIAKKGIILVEWHTPNQKKDIYDAHIGVWKRDYVSLLKEFFPKEKIILSKITPEIWPDQNWQKWGYIIEVKK